MEWQDEGIVLGSRRHGETSVIAEVMTVDHGRHLGMVRGGRSRTMRPVLQPGNRVSLHWRARLSEHLGEFRVEPIEQRAALLMLSAPALHGVQAMASLLRLLPERDPHRHLCAAMEVIIAHLDDASAAGELFVRFELALLNELGFGLDLAQCAASGVTTDLAYVSPKSGRAVSNAAGTPYADRMLALPMFLRPDMNEAADRADLEAGFRLTGFFLNRHVYEPRGLKPDTARESFIQATLKALDAASTEHQIR
ncbi:DNA repair protein RecO [Martelella mediterranea]|uniref:DNA repair protein RecO n=1 Tax=Martelella mediterranea TaxID=293089 RepID=UPI001E2BE61B|nr:DNA repair protein RecO [Martelella mediterranea]MCD1634519.1 DNA repair protein RecO [Martelella mediterranea]